MPVNYEWGSPVEIFTANSDINLQLSSRRDHPLLISKSTQKLSLNKQSTDEAKVPAPLHGGTETRLNVTGGEVVTEEP